MIRKQTLILLVVFAALLALVFYLQENPLPSEASQTPSPTAPAQVLAGLDSSDVRAITLTEAQGAEVAVTRDEAGTWRLQTEEQEQADTGKLEQIRAQIAAMQVMTFLPEDAAVDPGALGLDDPAYTLTVLSESGQQSVIRIGKPIPTGSGYYAQMNDQAPLVIDKFNVDTLVGLMNELSLAEPTEEILSPAP